MSHLIQQAAQGAEGGKSDQQRTRAMNFGEWDACERKSWSKDQHTKFFIHFINLFEKVTEGEVQRQTEHEMQSSNASSIKGWVPHHLPVEVDFHRSSVCLSLGKMVSTINS